MYGLYCTTRSVYRGVKRRGKMNYDEVKKIRHIYNLRGNSPHTIRLSMLQIMAKVVQKQHN
jgi:hypothetical protein